MERIPKSISFSGLTMWHNCPKLYYINYILGQYRFDSNVNTVFGSIVHKCVQKLLMKQIDKDSCKIEFERTWKRLCGLYKKYIDAEKYNLDSFRQSGIRMIDEIENRINEDLPGYVTRAVEFNLHEEIANDYPQVFNGFIDIVLETPEKKIVIGDFKVVNSTFFFIDSKDKYKDYQLTLYKHFYCKKLNIDPKDVETYFFLLEKSPKAKNIIRIERITSGNKKIDNALHWLNNGLRNINNANMWLKNKAHCEKYKDNPCPFRGTEFCK